MPKQTKPEVQLLLDDGGHLSGYLAKGHISREEFEAAIRLSCDNFFELGDLTVSHDIMRWVPNTPYQRVRCPLCP